MIDVNKTYRTRDGREVRIYATDCGEAEPIHGAIKCGQQWRYFIWTENGRYLKNKDTLSDLVEVRPRIKRTVWLNVNKHGYTAVYPTREYADAAVEQRLACVKVEIDCEEGEGL